MSFKKIASLVMAAALTMSLSTSAFATSTETEITDPARLATGATTKLTGKTTAGEISISVPTTGTVVLNPYKLKIDAATGDADATNGVEVQVASAWQAIQNKSTTTDIDVFANVTGTVGGNAKLSVATDMPTYAAEGNDGYVRTNDVWAYLETKVGDALETGALTAPTTVSFEADANGCTPNILLASRGTATKVGKLVKAATGSDSYLSFHINGIANQYAASPWTAKDTVGATIIFTFAPAIA